MEENKIVQLPVDTESALHEPEMKTSEMRQVVSLPDEREKRNDFTPDPAITPIPLSNFTEQSRDYLKNIIEGKIKASKPTKPSTNNHLNLNQILGLEVCENLSDADPIYQQLSYLDSLLTAIASDIGKKNTSKLSDAIADMLRDTLELGKFIKIVEDS